MVEGTCGICERKIVVKKDEDIVGTSYGSICSIECFDKLCDEVLGADRNQFSQ